MLEKCGVASNVIEGTIPRALEEPGKCSTTIIGHDYEEMTRLGRVLCEVYCRLHKRQTSSKISRSTQS